MNLAPGDLIAGKYRIVRLIGDGGMGSVYEARHELLGLPVALKFLHGELAKRPGLGARFLQEARVSATIQSTHVARVTDVDTAADGSPYLVMELLSGESLQRMLDRSRKLSRDLAVDFALQTLAGLEAAHALGVVHRDLKPDNVFVTPTPGGPLLKLIDFGIAKLRESNEYKKALTGAGMMMGTPEYMAPEQLYAASEVDHRADLYSLGVMLFEMLSGERPADGENAEVIIARVLSGNGKRLAELEPELPAPLVAVVERALYPDRDQRFSSAYELRRLLAPFARELSHAGGLAAMAAPAQAGDARALAARGGTSFGSQPTDTAMAPPPASGRPVPDTLDGPRLSGLPKTLPPELPADAAARGGTQAAPPPAVAPYALPAPAARGAAARRRRGRVWLWLALLGTLGAIVGG
ncbi:MAG TPA: serine/threonine-protein kinase, partial [Polyangiaceae bacterium]|nr:serine/threonine-protein kinase [Polyangiaceae bacterium]